jgi:hypothetical protein
LGQLEAGRGNGENLEGYTHCAVLRLESASKSLREVIIPIEFSASSFRDICPIELSARTDRTSFSCYYLKSNSRQAFELMV